MAEHVSPLIKICGMTREADAVLAIELGAHAIGMLFYEKSPRFVTIRQAQAIAKAVPSRGLKVGLFVDADSNTVWEVLDAVALDILQFHGSETAAYCASFGLPYWKALRAKDADSLAGLAAQYTEADGILLDTWHPTMAGGTGETFDWSILDGLCITKHLILAGGLNPGNVRSAVDQVQPWAVDVCSGVEDSPGIKSKQLMQKFINEVIRV
jgi:phosphoribosylanthranilate isomerase